jgi:hypothetical protein
MLARCLGFAAVATLSAGTVNAQTIASVTPPNRPAYVDANGTVVGLLDGGHLEAPLIVYRFNGADTFVLALQTTAVFSNQFRWVRTQVWYEGLDCTGRAFVHEQAGTARLFGGRRLAVVEYSTHALLLSAPDPQPEPMLPQSIRDDDGLCKTGTIAGNGIVVSPSGIDLDDRYTLPFRMEVRRFRGLR